MIIKETNVDGLFTFYEIYGISNKMLNEINVRILEIAKQINNSTIMNSKNYSLVAETINKLENLKKEIKKKNIRSSMRVPSNYELLEERIKITTEILKEYLDALYVTVKETQTLKESSKKILAFFLDLTFKGKPKGVKLNLINRIKKANHLATIVEIIYGFEKKQVNDFFISYLKESIEKSIRENYVREKNLKEILNKAIITYNKLTDAQRIDIITKLLLAKSLNEILNNVLKKYKFIIE